MKSFRTRKYYFSAVIILLGALVAVAAQAQRTERARLDIFPPTPPQNVVAVAQTPFIVQVTWNPSYDKNGVADYLIYRNGKQVGTSTTTSYSDVNLFSATTYSYTVAAVDPSGNTSAQSAAAVVTTPTGIPWRQVTGRNVKMIKVLVPDVGGLVDWSWSGNNQIAIDMQGPDGYFDVYTMNTDGSGITCITCNAAGIPQRNNGNPAWHPSGQYIVFESQDPALNDIIGSYPGTGLNDNIWVMNADGSNPRQITHVTENNGSLHPHFSHDGTKLLWSEKIGPCQGVSCQLGSWVVRLADFNGANANPVSNIRTYQPVANRFYETGDFSPDDSTIYYYANPLPNQTATTIDIIAQKWQNNIYTDLTPSTSVWQEHAHVAPNGQLVYMTTLNDMTTFPLFTTYITDFWLMNPDASNQRQITFFNDPTAPEYIPTYTGVAAADNCWSPDGTQFVAFIATRRGVPQQGSIILVQP